MKSTLTASRKSSYHLDNRIEATFDDINYEYVQQPLSPVEDVDAQLAAGEVAGDASQKINPKTHNLLGVVYEPQALKVAWSYLDLGARDTGGLRNNCHPKFKTWFLDALDLHQEKVIKIVSSRLTKYGFEYFRIKNIDEKPDLTVEIKLVAYNVEYMNTFETEFEDLEDPELPGDYDPPSGDPPPWNPPVCPLRTGTITYENNLLIAPIEECNLA
jgi:hypothetical protein